MRHRKGTDLPQVRKQKKWCVWVSPQDSTNINRNARGVGEDYSGAGKSCWRLCGGCWEAEHRKGRPGRQETQLCRFSACDLS